MIVAIDLVTLSTITDCHYNAGKGGERRDEIKGMIQNKPINYGIINWKQLIDSMEGRDGFSVETEKLKKTLCYGEKVAESSI